MLTERAPVNGHLPELQDLTATAAVAPHPRALEAGRGFPPAALGADDGELLVVGNPRLAGLLAGIAGIMAVVSTVRAHLRYKLPIGTLLGFLLTGFAVVSLSVFMIAWGLGPF